MKETKQLPNEITLERQVLAYIMNETDGLFIAQRENLISDNFYDANNKMIFDEMIALDKENISSGMQVLMTRVKSVEPTTIMNIAIEGKLLHEGDFCDYIKLLQEYYMKRQAIYLTRPLESLYNKGTDVFEVLDTVRGTLDNIGKMSATDGLEGSDMLNKAMELVQYKIDNPNKSGGVTTGFRFLDNIIGGFDAEELIIIGARTGMGKTTLALNLCVNAMKKGYKSMFVSLEMSTNALTYKMASDITGIEYSDFNEGKLSSDEMTIVNKTCSPILSNLFSSDATGITLEKLKALARQRSKTDGLDIIYVDYLQIMNVGDQNYNKKAEHEKLGYISRELKNLAAELKIPVVALAQLSRGLEKSDNKKPMMSDLRGSGAIEQDANKILFIHRDAYYNDSNSDECEIIVAKNRSGGLGSVPVTFNGATSSFRQVTKEAKPVVINDNKPTQRYNQPQELSDFDTNNDISRVTNQTMFN